MPIDIIELSGTPAEMARQHTEQARVGLRVTGTWHTDVPVPNGPRSETTSPPGN